MVNKDDAVHLVVLVLPEERVKKDPRVIPETLVHLASSAPLVLKVQLENLVSTASVVYLDLLANLVYLVNLALLANQAQSVQKVSRVPRANLDQRETKDITV